MSLRIVVYGIVGRSPFAGVAWQALHYLEGLRALGHDVHYAEDTGDWPYDPIANEVCDDPSGAVAYVGRVMDRAGFGDRWTFLSAARPGETFGDPAVPLDEVLATADVLVNVCAATLIREQHQRIPVRIYVETDPVEPQIDVARGRPQMIELLDSHTHHFSFGENLGAPDCRVPIERYTYRPTRQPVVLDWWRPPPGLSNGRFTTVGNWEQTHREVEWDGELYSWSKHHEFLKVIDLPRVTERRFELALASADDEAQAMLRSHGWSVVDAMSLTTGMDPYRSYIWGSRGEFTVAKDQNVRLRSGWFSDRSATYLAAGRPVVTQDTGFGAALPTGEGLFAFGTLDDAAAAIAEIDGDYERHARAAAEIGREHFGADRVLGAMLADVGA